jgi:ABC-type taurine transport system ATPase subunit
LTKKRGAIAWQESASRAFRNRSTEIVAHGQFETSRSKSKTANCGKSTTLRMLAGLEQVSSGEIRIGGRNVTRLPPKDRDIAMVFQNYALYPQKSVYENMAFGLRVRGEANDEIEKRVREAARTATSSAVWPLVRSRDRTRVRIGERSRGAPQNGIDLDGRLLRAKSTSSKKGQS